MKFDGKQVEMASEAGAEGYKPGTIIKGSGSGLEYGAYFRKYKTVDGHTITDLD